MLVVELVMKMGHLIGILLRVEGVRGVQYKPLSEFEHGGELVHVLLKGQLEVLLLDEPSFPELFIER